MGKFWDKQRRVRGEPGPQPGDTNPPDCGTSNQKLSMEEQLKAGLYASEFNMSKQDPRAGRRIRASTYVKRQHAPIAPCPIDTIVDEEKNLTNVQDTKGVPGTTLKYCGQIPTGNIQAMKALKRAAFVELALSKGIKDEEGNVIGREEGIKDQSNLFPYKYARSGKEGGIKSALYKEYHVPTPQGTTSVYVPKGECTPQFFAAAGLYMPKMVSDADRRDVDKLKKLTTTKKDVTQPIFDKEKD